MTSPSSALPTASLLAAAALFLGACGSPTPGPGRQMTFPTSSAPSSSASSSPTGTTSVPRVPPPREPVTGRGLVLQNGDRPPQLCLGPVETSSPLQCNGTPLIGWSWATSRPQDTEAFGGAASRSGSYAVTGRFDGRSLTVTDAVPLAPDDDPEPSPRPSAPPDLDSAQWDAVMRALDATPGLIELGREPDNGPMQLVVDYDDGTLQAWADASFGAGVVVVTSALR